MQSALCVFFMAREIPLIVPPVPAPATKASTFMDEGFDEVDGVETTASINSGPVVCSWANGLFGYKFPIRDSSSNDELRYIHYDTGQE